MTSPYIITIDGESASGKSTIADQLSSRLGYLHVDSGVVFRTFAYLADINDIELSALSSEMKAEEILRAVNIKGQIVYHNGKNITDYIQTEGAALRAAQLGSYEFFQQWFVDHIRKKVKELNCHCIVSGRIGGSIVFPNAYRKFYLKADIEVKAKRRLLQLKNIPISELTLEKIVKSILTRDSIKSIISYWNVKVPEDTIIVDTTRHSIPQVLQNIFGRIGLTNENERWEG